MEATEEFVVSFIFILNTQAETAVDLWNFGWDDGPFEEER